MKIYFDTNIWNQSLNQNLQPQLVMRSLVDAGKSPVFSIHAFYELQKTFHSAGPGSQEKGRALFSHLSDYFGAGLIYIAKETTELLAAEMYGLRGSEGSSKFLEIDDLVKIVTEVERLASGDVALKWGTHTLDKTSELKGARFKLLEHFQRDTPVQQALRNIPESELERWMQRECRSQQSLLRLTDHILRQFPDAPRGDVMDWANALLTQSSNNFTLSLLRADLYSNWRCVNRGSIPSDLLDDMYHVLNASYCDLYVTAEPKQENYASLLLPRETRVEIYRKEAGPLDKWLQSL